MRRRAFNVFSILSLLVFVTSVSLWVRSYFVGETFQRLTMRTDSSQQPAVTHVLTCGIHCAGGRIGIGRQRGFVNRPVNVRNGWEYYRSGPAVPAPRSSSPVDRVYVHFGKFSLRHTVTPAVTGNFTGSFSEQELSVPLWVFLPAALPPLLWLRRRRRTLGPGFPITPTSDL